MKRPARKERCWQAARCTDVKRASKYGMWSRPFTCECSLHSGKKYTLYLFDKSLMGNPIYNLYENGKEPAGLMQGPRGFIIKGQTRPAMHLHNVDAPGMVCGLTGVKQGYTTMAIKRVSCFDCIRWLNSPTGVQHLATVDARRFGKTTEILKSVYTECAADVADEFYPKGDPRRGEFLRDVAVLFTKLQPKLVEVMQKQRYLTKTQVVELMSTHQIIEDIEHDGYKATSTN